MSAASTSDRTPCERPFEFISASDAACRQVPRMPDFICGYLDVLDHRRAACPAARRLKLSPSAMTGLTGCGKYWRPLLVGWMRAGADARALKCVSGRRSRRPSQHILRPTANDLTHGSPLHLRTSEGFDETGAAPHARPRSGRAERSLPGKAGKEAPASEEGRLETA